MDIRAFNFKTLKELQDFQKLLNECVEFHKAIEDKKARENASECAKMRRDHLVKEHEKCLSEAKTANLGARIALFNDWLEWAEENCFEDEEIDFTRLILDYQELFEDVLE